ncbi:hypothetical protein MY04_2572 [Flammeovirga sp. MY04]|uniref:hypothetical protein n=1 Tax=Flammeovirga sp. MY04 TaxID=1191459 RepID=UPI0008061CC7|nr:hypothetical protein [Flammeovirga sp. MY04]ANQ49941.1 hypothetical protein MY04_2572 [Flammeovirga sp. MY04]
MAKIIELIINNGSPVLLILVCLFWGKNIIEYFFRETIEIKKNELNQGLELHKKNIEIENKKLQHDLNSKLEDHKNKLELIKSEFDVQFSYLHKERANVIKELYKKLVKFDSAMNEFIKLLKIKTDDQIDLDDEIVEQMISTRNNLINFFTLNRIFIPGTTCKKIDDTIHKYDETAFAINFYHSEVKKVKMSKEEIKTCIDESKRLENSIPELLSEIEDLFRSLLGDK